MDASSPVRPITNRLAPSAREMAGLIVMLWLLILLHGAIGDALAAATAPAARGAAGAAYVLSGALVLSMALATLSASYLAILRRGFGPVRSRPASAAPAPAASAIKVAPISEDEAAELAADDEAWHPGEPFA